MRYFKEETDVPLEDSTTYYETDEGTVIRQLTANESRTIGSNREDPECGMWLADIPIDPEEMDDLVPINKEEFESVWSRHLETHREEWEKVKDRNPIGSLVEGFLNVFYPHGVIIDLEEGGHGVANADEYQASTHSSNLLPGRKVTGTVKGYGEVNQWIILDNIKPSEEVEDTGIP